MRSFIIVIFLLNIFSCGQPPSKQTSIELSPADINDIICFWDFQEKNDGKVNLTAAGPYNYTLTEMNGPIRQVNDGIFGPSALEIERGQWLRILREDCPALNIHGEQEVSIFAWIKRRVDVHWQYIAGMWDERADRRQYALFTAGHMQTNYVTMERIPADNQVHGYVSDVGGATPGKPWSFSYATGKQRLDKDVWYMIGYTYNLKEIKVYFNGELDVNEGYNPYVWDKPILDAGKEGSDFTIAQRDVHSWPDYPEGVPGNKVGFGGILGGVAVYNRALEPEEISKLYESTMKRDTKNAD